MIRACKWNLVVDNIYLIAYAAILMTKPIDTGSTQEQPGSSAAAEERLALERQVYLQLVRIQDQFGNQFEELFREYGLSRRQYGALRVISPKPEGICCGDFRAGLSTRVPDVTRLIDRLLRCGLVQRRNADDDRRSVIVSLSAKGRELMETLQGPVTELNKQQLGHMTRDELLTLHRLLIKAQGRR